MTSVVSKRMLKLSLLCLLGFTIFCLIVLEVVLNDRKLQNAVSIEKGGYKAFFTRDVNSSSTAQHQQQQQSGVGPGGNTLKFAANVSRPGTAAPPTSSGTGTANLTSGATTNQKNLTSAPSTNASSAASTGAKAVVKQTTAAQQSLATEKLTPKPPSVTDYCVLVSASVNVTGFRQQDQLLPDGTRPVNCSGCFNSDFPSLINGCGVCNAGVGGKGNEVDVVMVILTTHKATDKRQAIRETWASVTKGNTANVRHVFLFGRVQDEGAMQIVRQEHTRYGDVIMYDFMDSYANLTLKTLTAMHWATRYCGHARFLLKADDDMWVNVPSLISTVNRENDSLQTSVGGACHMRAGPIRNPASKWYASMKAYPQNSYPGFCSGTSYVTSLNVARSVLSVSPNVPFFYLEDVYVSLCIKRLGPPFKLKPLPGFFHGGGESCRLRKPETVTVHEVPPHRLRSIWNAKC